MDKKQKTRIYRNYYASLYNQSPSDYFKRELPAFEYEILYKLWKDHDINKLLLNEQFEIIRVRYDANRKLTAQRYVNGTWSLKYTWI